MSNDRNGRSSRPGRHQPMMSPRVRVNEILSIGPGKIKLLREVQAQRSISGAARAMGMPYKRAWSLLNTLNQGLGQPVVETFAGGSGGGGARLTPLGNALLERYSALEERVREGTERELAALLALCGPE